MEQNKILLLRNLNHASEMLLSGNINKNMEWLMLRMNTLVEIIERYTEDKEKYELANVKITDVERDILNAENTTFYMIDHVMKYLLGTVLKGATSSEKRFYYKNLFCSLTLYTTGGLLELKINDSTDMVSHGFIDHNQYNIDTIIAAIDAAAREIDFNRDPIDFLVALSSNTYMYADVFLVENWEDLGLKNRGGVLYYLDELCDPNTEEGRKVIGKLYDKFIDRGINICKYIMAVRYSELLAMLYMS